MTPKEKAKELLDTFKFADIYFVGGNETMLQNAKNCALLCVDEKKETIDKMFNGYYTMPKEWQEEYDNLDKVRQEINKL